MQGNAEGLKYIAAKVTSAAAPPTNSFEILPASSTISLAATMTWTGLEGARFIRPIRWLVGVLDGKPLKFSFGGITAGDNCWSSFPWQAANCVTSFADYEKKSANWVIRPAERCEKKIEQESPPVT